MIKLDKQFKANYGAYIYALAVVFLVVDQLLAGVLFQLFSVFIKKDGQNTLRYGLSFIFQLTNFFVFFIFVLKTKAKPDYLFFKDSVQIKKPRTRGVLIYCFLGIIFALICLFCFLCVAESAQMLLKKLDFNFSDEFVRGIPAQNVLLVVLSVLAAPVCEELVYRSGLLSGLKKKFGKILASVLCGIAFAFMHMNPEQTVYQFCLGFGASMLTLYSGSVIPAIIMHAVSNLIVSLSMMGVGGFIHYFDFYEKTFIRTSSSVFAVFTVIFATVGFALFILLPKAAHKIFKLKNDESSLPDCRLNSLSKDNTMIIYFASLAICVFMWLSMFFM